MTEQLQGLLRAITNTHVYIQTHNFPDPDAIASAYGLQNLLKYCGVDSTVCYHGQIERYNTNYIVQRLGIHFRQVMEIGWVMHEDDEIILVDTQKLNSNVENIKGTYIAVIDHHPVFFLDDYRFADIRPEIGACATIVAEYFFTNKIPMDDQTALALSFGIRSDTARLFRSVSQLDMDMLARMFPLVDREALYYLENSEMEFSDLKAYAKAIESIRLYDGNVAFAFAGENCPEALVASVSDFILSLVGVDFSVVYSKKEAGLKLSVRCSSGINAGIITANALEGLGSGGGHVVMAAGFVPFKGDDKELKQLVRRIRDAILREIRMH